jgi:hypothetical protein
VCTDISAHNAAGTDREPWSRLSVDHLQLAPGITEALRSRGVQTLGDACVAAEGALASIAPYAPELIEAVRQLRAAASGSNIEWRRYWELRGWRFQQLAAALPEFDRLEVELGTAPVNRKTLGNAGGMLQASGISTFGALIKGLRSGLGPVRGIGLAKLEVLFRRLLELADEVPIGRSPLEGRVGNTSDVMEIPVLCAEARALPVSILQLGSKCQWLRDAGYQTVGDLVDADLRSVEGLKAVGPRTMKTIRQRLEELSMASINGVIDWQRFSEASGLPLLPADPVLSGRQLLDVLPEVLATLGSHLDDDGYRDILANRLTQGPQDQATLEEIGLRSQPVVSRERIRQKEKKLLSQLTGALIWDRDGRLGIQFHPTFTAWWRKAAAEFAGVDEIDFDEFVGRLASTWEVTVAALTTHLPFITAVVTGEPRMPAALRAGASLDPRLFGLLPSEAATSLFRFRLGKAAQRLAAQGIVTLGDLVRAASAGNLSQNLGKGLDAIAAGIGPDGMLDWEAYAAAAGLDPLPSMPLTNAPAFLAGFNETVCALLTRLRRSDRTARIFALRTRHPPRTRMTLEAVASAIGTYASHVKNEETALLEQLHDIVVEREFAEVPVWIDQTWLDRCREAHHAFEASGSDYVRFLNSLALRWGVSHTAAESAAPGLWAIFTGYPQGRRRGVANDRADFAVAPELSSARIRLRGFRRVH